MMADDDEDDQLILTDAIRNQYKTQVRISAVANGAELLLTLHRTATAGEALPDVIMLDINMPVLDGLETLRQIKNNPLIRHIPVYIVTTLRNMDKLDMSLMQGAANFFTKPSNMNGYVRIIEEVMAHVLQDN
jgi:CheY-like chemotaxis protein